MGGGGGGSSSRIAEQQERREQERLAAIQQGTSAVNQIFDNPGREAEIGEVLAAQRGLYFDALGRQHDDAERQLRFSLARSGLAGSRQSVDSGRRLGEAYQRGTVDAENLAQTTVNNLRQSDEDARAQLIAMVQSGADATTASTIGNARLRQNVAGARASGNVSALGDVFGGFSDMFKRSREREADRRAREDLNTLYNTAGMYGYRGGNN